MYNSFQSMKLQKSKLIFLSSLLVIGALGVNAQITRKVLFLGNSYTAVNNLPQLIHDVALSAGDTLQFDSNTPGGYTLNAHSTDNLSLNKMRTAGWDYVVLQGQSQEPVTQSSVFQHSGDQLNDSITKYNPCSVTMLYMTWGRKNGDASNCANFPVMCTYEGMDSTIRNEYLKLASSINGEVSPVSILWKYLRQNNPGIELYQADESHPSLAGSYAAACCFYSTIFKKDPTLITFNSGLNAADALVIRDAAKSEVFDHLNLWDYKQPPESEFYYFISSNFNEVIFNSDTHGTAETYYWDFGDGNTASTPNPAHSYAADGTYVVSLTTTNCDLNGLNTSTTDTVIQFCNHTPTVYITHPLLCNYDTLWTEAGDSYQWFNYGNAIPETNQYLANYGQYGIGGFSVLTTVNNCSELSTEYFQFPAWSGYYFDAIGDPCAGDTVVFAVLHINGSLSGFENIEWYKNDTLLTSMANEDTLFITDEGTYECRVINPNTDCPFDTTTSSIEYDCGASGVGAVNHGQEIFWNIFPNPASEKITIKFKNHVQDEVQIYSITGRLIKTVMATGNTEINITDLAPGIYCVRLKNKGATPLKFIKL